MSTPLLADGGGDPTEPPVNDINDKPCTGTIAIVCAILATVFLISTVGLSIALGLQYSKDGPVVTAQEDSTTDPKENSGKIPKLDWPQPSGSFFARYKNAAVASDNGLCSEIGRDILIEGGNAIDSTIATLLCIGVVNPKSSGLGGGFLMTLFDSNTGRCVSINARETAPLAATKDMFVESALESAKEKKSNATVPFMCTKESCLGYKAIAIPSELHGFWRAFKRFGSGKVSWQRLFRDAIDLCNNGFPVSPTLAAILADPFKGKQIQETETVRNIFVNKLTGRLYQEGEVMTRKILGATLERLANATDPVQLFYGGGEIAQTIATEISDNGGLITLEDLSKYETVVDEDPIVSDVLAGDLAMCGPPPPSSFVITQSIIAVMAEFYSKQSVDLNDPLVYHRLIEAQKFAYAQRTKLGDARFVAKSKKLVDSMITRAYIKKIKNLIKDESQPIEYYSGDKSTQVPDHGTSHVSIIDQHGNGVSATSTINLSFGSMRASPTLGIIWNNEMDDFSTPGLVNAFGFTPSEENYIEPGKRPMSSMSPMVIYNKKDKKIRMVVGASGGSLIISATAQTVIGSLLFNQTIKEAVDAPRLHHQYLPFKAFFEHSTPKALVETLTTKYKQVMAPAPKPKSVVQAVEVGTDGFIYGNSDFRRQTSTYPAGF